MHFVPQSNLTKQRARARIYFLLRLVQNMDRSLAYILQRSFVREKIETLEDKTNLSAQTRDSGLAVLN
jgi:hypothetical protein